MVFGITINIMFHGLSLCLNERAIIITNLTKQNNAINLNALDNDVERMLFIGQIVRLSMVIH